VKTAALLVAQKFHREKKATKRHSFTFKYSVMNFPLNYFSYETALLLIMVFKIFNWEKYM